MAEPIPAWPGEFVGLGDGEVFVRTAEVGDGAEPALFVHGFGGSSTNWTDLMHLLSTSGDGAGVVCDALDLPGFGRSPPLFNPPQSQILPFWTVFRVTGTSVSSR